MQTSEYYSSIMSMLNNVPSSATKSSLIDSIASFHKDNGSTLLPDQYIERFNARYSLLIELILKKEQSKQTEIVEGILARVGTIEKVMLALAALQFIGVAGYLLYLIMK